jgi:hypothetical protein
VGSLVMFEPTFEQVIDASRDYPHVEPKEFYEFWKRRKWVSFTGKPMLSGRDLEVALNCWEHASIDPNKSTALPVRNRREPVHISRELPKVLEKYQIKALPTNYDDIVFRSRIEARWAVFFNALNLEYEYEKEGYDLGGSVLYLPDFWVPALDSWIEIKGQEPDDYEAEKACRLSVSTGKRVYVFFGGHVVPDAQTNPPSAYVFFPDEGSDYEYWWCECALCGLIGIEYMGRSDRLKCKECYHCWDYRNPPTGLSPDALEERSLRWDEHTLKCTKRDGCQRTGANGDKGYNYDSPKLKEAFRQARAVRFGR